MPTHCDRCPGKATILWWHPETQAELGSCIHHGREWAPILHEQGWLRIYSADREPATP